ERAARLRCPVNATVYQGEEILTERHLAPARCVHPAHLGAWIPVAERSLEPRNFVERARGRGLERARLRADERHRQARAHEVTGAVDRGGVSCRREYKKKNQNSGATDCAHPLLGALNPLNCRVSMF